MIIPYQTRAKNKRQNSRRIVVIVVKRPIISTLSND